MILGAVPERAGCGVRAQESAGGQVFQLGREPVSLWLQHCLAGFQVLSGDSACAVCVSSIRVVTADRSVPTGVRRQVVADRGVTQQHRWLLLKPTFVYCKKPDAPEQSTRCLHEVGLAVPGRVDSRYHVSVRPGGRCVARGSPPFTWDAARGPRWPWCCFEALPKLRAGWRPLLSTS